LGDNWQSTTANWSQADFTGDNVVNLSDLQILGDNWGFGVGPDLSFDEALAVVGVPEPTSLVLLGLGGLLLARRR
ncbi:MAG: PEP-CTERM sorting domain-containing protein, partial [Phycisphaeraceae bacterium]|nr:PEP-CTERM sorting domain-containing protein [Phycisphaeraceae bacterium]